MGRLEYKGEQGARRWKRRRRKMMRREGRRKKVQEREMSVGVYKKSGECTREGRGGKGGETSETDAMLEKLWRIRKVCGDMSKRYRKREYVTSKKTLSR